MVTQFQQLPESFRSRVAVDGNGCWLWTGSLSVKGYGHFTFAGKTHRAHRFAYEVIVGAVPEKYDLDHLCRVRRCVNVDHLEAVTHRENVRRGELHLVSGGKTHCPQGHEYTAENIRQRSDGRRSCKTCHRIKRRAYVAAQKAGASS